MWHNRYMKISARIVLALLVVGLLPAGLMAQPPAPGAAPGQDIQVHPANLLPNGRSPLPGILTGGQPDDAQLGRLADVGYQTVVNLRTPGEPGAPADEAAKVEAEGMHYVSIPVAHGEGLSRENAEALGKVLADPDARPVVIHCGSGNRVGALLALEAAWVEGKPPAEALELGKAAGLTSLAPQVEKLLGLDVDGH